MLIGWANDGQNVGLGISPCRTAAGALDITSVPQYPDSDQLSRSLDLQHTKSDQSPFRLLRRGKYRSFL